MEAFRKNESENLRANREGLKGWLNPTRYGWERLSYWLMRLTGLFLLLYFIGHVYETSSLVGGVDPWNSMLALTQTAWGHLFLILVIGNSLRKFSKDSQYFFERKYDYENTLYHRISSTVCGRSARDDEISNAFFYVPGVRKCCLQLSKFLVRFALRKHTRAYFYTWIQWTEGHDDRT